MRDFRNIGILLFCTVQILMIGVESIPESASDSVSRTVRRLWHPLTHPYSVLTGQWQNWNLFAPEPFVDDPSFVFEVKQGDEWTEKHTIRPGTYAWWRETNMLKVLRFFVEDDETYKPVRERFLETMRSEFDLPRDAELRLRVITTPLSHGTS